MIASTEKHAIICRSYGTYSLCDATLANAMQALDTHIDSLDPEIKAIAASFKPESPLAYVSVKLMTEALAEVLSLGVGEPTVHLRRLLHGRAPKEGEDTRPQVLLEQAWVQEMAMFMVSNGLTVESLRRLDGRRLAELTPDNKLSFLQPFRYRVGKAIRYPSHDIYFDIAADYNVIMDGRWKETAQEHKVVARILQFINDNLVDTSDIRFDVEVITASFV